MNQAFGGKPMVDSPLRLRFTLPGLQQISEKPVSLKESPRSPALEPKVLAWWLVSSGHFLASASPPPTSFYWLIFRNVLILFNIHLKF